MFVTYREVKERERLPLSTAVMHPADHGRSVVGLAHCRVVPSLPCVVASVPCVRGGASTRRAGDGTIVFLAFAVSESVRVERLAGKSAIPGHRSSRAKSRHGNILLATWTSFDWETPSCFYCHHFFTWIR